MNNLKFNHDSDNVLGACSISKEELLDRTDKIIEFAKENIVISKTVEHLEELLETGDDVAKRAIVIHAAFSIQEKMSGGATEIIIGGGRLPDEPGEALKKSVMEHGHDCDTCEAYDECDLPIKMPRGEGAKKDESADTTVCGHN